MQFRVLGTLEVLDDEGRTIDLGGAHQRTVLARLLTAGGRPVPVATIVDDLWGGTPPPSAAGTLQSYISRLRRALGPDGASLLTRDPGGYRLAADSGDVDFQRFERMAEQGREQLSADDAATASATLGSALGLWRGPALAEWSDLEWAQGIATRLEERRLAAVEDRVRADLDLGRHEQVVVELGQLVAAHPFRERLAASLATALYGSGRQADALRAIADLRTRLLDGLGLDPGPGISELEMQILHHDAGLLPHGRRRAAASPGTGGSGGSAPAGPTVVSASQSRHVVGLETGRLIGRTSERSTLGASLDAALEGRPQWALIEGEAGIGKTRLVEDVADAAVGAGVDVLWGRAYEGGANPAFWLWLQPLRALMESSPPLTDAGLADLIDRLLAPAGDDELIGSPSDPRRLRLFEAVSVLIEHAARHTPRMIILDDVHWADPASLELMSFVARRSFAAPLLVVVTARLGESSDGEALEVTLGSVARRPQTPRLTLRGVSLDECADLVEQATGHRLGLDVAAAVFARAEGNPFFTRELARLLDADDGLSDAELARRAAVPAGVRDVVRRRLRLLPAETVDLLRIAAVLGRHVSVPLLARTADISIERCIDALEPAVAARLLSEVPLDVAVVRFEHALVQEVVVGELSMLRRARLHLRAADVIEAMGGIGADDAEIVADHLWQAAAVVPGDRAALALERAADVAARRMALETAVDLLERSLQLRQALPAAEVDAMTELAVMRRATALRRAVSGYARAGERIARAKELARQSGSYDVLAELIWTEWAGMATVGVPGEARRLAAELAAVAAAADDAALTAVSLSASGVTELSFGDLGLGCRDLDRALAARGSAGQVDGGRSSDDGRGWLLEGDIIAVCFQAIAHQLAGVADPALASLRPLAEAISEPYARLVLWVFEGMRALLASDLDAAWLAGKHAVEEASDGGFEFYLAGGSVVLGEVLIRTGSPAEGIASIERGVDAYARAGTRTFVPWFAATAALGSLQLGEVEAAGRWVERAASTLAESGEHWQQPAVDIARAKVDAATGAATSAEAAARIDAALEHARAAGAHGLVARLRDDR